MLVAMTCTILLMLAITQTFQSIGEVSAKGRAGIEMSTQLRGVWLRLQEDLQGLTVPVRPWPDADGAAGYFEYYDGALRDNTFVYSDMRNSDQNGNNLVGDVDDIIAFTFGHELAHHYLGHTGCANGQPMGAGPDPTKLGRLLSVLPAVNQLGEAASDSAG